MNFTHFNRPMIAHWFYKILLAPIAHGKLGALMVVAKTATSIQDTCTMVIEISKRRHWNESRAAATRLKFKYFSLQEVITAETEDVNSLISNKKVATLSFTLTILERRKKIFICAVGLVTKAPRIASNYHDSRYRSENSLWTTKYQPERAIEICGNYESVKFLNEWLRLWHEKGSRTNKCFTDNDNWIMQDVDLNYSPSDCESEDTDEETSLKNVLLVTGPVGSGKSAAIYACAKEQGFQVIEVNTSDWRNGALVKQK